MQSALRPYATAGVAIVGAGLIAAPSSGPLPGIRAVREVVLTAGDSSPLDDFLAPWTDQYNTAAQNATVLANNFFLAPAVALQQAIVNHSDFLSQVLNDPSTIPDVAEEMRNNLKTVSDSFALIGADKDTITTVTNHTLSGGFALSGPAGHAALLQLLPTFLPPDLAHTLTPILNLLASPLSGIIMGSLGPFLSPGVALLNSIQAVAGDLGTDPSAALRDLMAVPANMIGAFFNGADLNLDALIPVIANSGLLPLPIGTTVEHMDLALGGLFSPGEVAVAPYEVLGSGGTVVNEVPAVGGSIFNSLGLTLSTSAVGFPTTLDFFSSPVGPLGAWLGLSELIGYELGNGWSGKNAPAPAVPPITGLSFPLIPDDGGGAGSAAASEFSGAIGQLLGGGDAFSDIF